MPVATPPSKARPDRDLPTLPRQLPSFTEQAIKTIADPAAEFRKLWAKADERRRELVSLIPLDPSGRGSRRHGRSGGDA